MVLYEKEATCGGHTLTDTTSEFPIDLGFQVCATRACRARAPLGLGGTTAIHIRLYLHVAPLCIL